MKVTSTMQTRCEICGKGRGGGPEQKVNHVKCSKIRAEIYRKGKKSK
ncbi:hypothetical protein AH02_30 [Pseudomonas phage AH02]|nr:hypothetical protein AH02_30 [Pseudomonas phage AH02]